MLTLKRVAVFVFLLNLVLLIYTIYVFLQSQNQSSQPTLARSAVKAPFYTNPADLDRWEGVLGKADYNLDEDGLDGIGRKKKTTTEESESNKKVSMVIEIWSKAAIGYYLWDHIFNGNLNKLSSSQAYVYGSKKVGDVRLKFRSGPALTIHSLRQFLTRQDEGGRVSDDGSAKNMVLVLNGREESKVKHAKQWLNELKYLQRSQSSIPFNVGVVMLGSENCFNSWIKPYLTSQGGFVRFLFVVYDWTAVDDKEIFQWPLGVATYRNFPSPDSLKLNLQLNRPYLCNFFGTIYSNSSRAELMQLLLNKEAGKRCFVKPRWKWQPNENADSLESYVHGLRLSDLTLSPIGMNHECYRIYESISYGSVPVLEENLRHVAGGRSACDHSSAYRLLRTLDAPVLYVKNWTLELPRLLQEEGKLGLESKIRRRKSLLQWYEKFKETLKRRFLEVVRVKFLGH